MRAVRHEDLGHEAVLYRLECDGGLVGLHVGHGLADLDLVAHGCFSHLAMLPFSIVGDRAGIVSRMWSGSGSRERQRQWAGAECARQAGGSSDAPWTDSPRQKPAVMMDGEWGMRCECSTLTVLGQVMLIHRVSDTLGEGRRQCVDSVRWPEER